LFLTFLLLKFLLSPSTIAIESIEAPIIISISDNCKTTWIDDEFSSILPTLASEIKFRKECQIKQAAEAAKPANASGIMIHHKTLIESLPEPA
jgi:hypothetical protein